MATGLFFGGVIAQYIFASRLNIYIYSFSIARGPGVNSMQIANAAKICVSAAPSTE